MFRVIQKFFILALITMGISWGADTRPLGDPIALTMPGEFLIAAQWSPDGSQLAAAGASYTGLYLIDFPTGNTSKLSNDYSAGYGFSWSHNGENLAVKTSRFEGMFRKHTLRSINISTRVSSDLSDERTGMSGTPMWSSNDNYIYLTQTENFESFALNQAKTPAVDALITFLKQGRLTQIDQAKSAEIAIFENQADVSSYAISPDGTHIAYSTMGQQLWVARSDGSNVQSLGSGLKPSWSPDSEWIVFMLTTDDGHTIQNSDVYITHTSDRTPINITNTQTQLEMHPQWSPDGAWIVYDTDERGQLFIQQMDWR